MAKNKTPISNDRPFGTGRNGAGNQSAYCSFAETITNAVGSLREKLLSTVFVTNAVSRARSAVFTVVWYIPALFVITMGLTALYSPRAALWLLLGGFLVFAGSLFFIARLIRSRYHALLARMPKINGQTPKRLEFHAVVLGVGDRPSGLDALDPMDLEESLDDEGGYDGLEAVMGDVLNEDDVTDKDDDTEIEDMPLAVGGGEPPRSERENETKKTSNDPSDEELSAFEMYEVPLLRRERRKKTLIH